MMEEQWMIVRARLYVVSSQARRDRGMAVLRSERWDGVSAVFSKKE